MWYLSFIEREQNVDKSKKTFWPYAIVLSIIGCVIACTATIIISLDYPVEMDNYYFERHQNINSNINEILASQKEFKAKFDVSFNDTNKSMSRAEPLNIILTPKTAQIPQLKYDLLLTRPDTNKQNINLNATYHNGILSTQDVKFPVQGRWQLMAKISDLNTTAFYKFEFFVGK
ncbi:FixH family protein [Campylobacter sp. RM9344]|uniref:FixH family protein n=1 Tax=Campylobacter californiensis TaxID=1032243 RepID=A0AAW3ZW51_9BACT|nr:MULTISPECIES: FixH family protein [unclassified Campylobacter]MBE2994953.1 FixH family protein [Campylobacter sp. RM6913]MBE3022959.1 FixH family protein [Campylobacter sp. 7477a]MBE3028958.1 FixH family protein [Campylobacter sp. RM9344]MBE3607316.1 FixH family protein [Campylobacter sp. RM9337]MBE3609544.1 FixH family protein [Campylobacter sp. RM12916]